MPKPSAFASPVDAFRAHWRLYLDEAAELALFMISACVCTVLLFHPEVTPVQNAWAARGLMGLVMGLTAVAIIKSPMGNASGAHFNPAITLTFYRLGKIGPYDAAFYVVFQFLGGLVGVALSALMLGTRIAAPQVDYAVTIPGVGGRPAAFAAETFMAALMMMVVLTTSSRPKLARYTTWLVGLLIANDVLFLAPVSGFSINPARTFASAVFARQYEGIWIYFTAPLLGMFGAAEVYLRTGQRTHAYLRHRHLTQQPS